MQEREETPSNDREYLSEWPPVDEESDSESCTKAKRPKVDREDCETTGKGCRDNEECTLWARIALAKWWRRRKKEQNVSELRRLPKSNNPNTLLRYVARQGYEASCDSYRGCHQLVFMAGHRRYSVPLQILRGYTRQSWFMNRLRLELSLLPHDLRMGLPVPCWSSGNFLEMIFPQILTRITYWRVLSSLCWILQIQRKLQQ